MTVEIEGPLKIVALEAENIKRLIAVEIRPDGALVQITGKNGAGKTSILDAIFWALAGKKNIQINPIRDGAEEARVKLDMGELIVTRHFKRAKAGAKEGYSTSLEVQTASGAAFGHPQQVIDAFLGELSFDPLAFLHTDAKGRFGLLKKLIPAIDWDAMAEADEADRARRLEIGRDQRKEEGAAAAIVVPPGTPGQPVDEETLADELEKAAAHNADIDTCAERRKQATVKIEEWNAQIAECLRRRDEMVNKLAAAEGLPAPIDVEVLRTKQREIRAANANVQAEARRRGHVDRAGELKLEYEALTAKLEAREAARRKAIDEAGLPIPGLAIAGEEITLAGEPFDQASDAEQLRASIAIAMALNPMVRVIRVRDGSLLDSASLAVVAAMAEDRGFQIWIERVHEGAPVGFMIQDGRLAKAEASAGQIAAENE